MKIRQIIVLYLNNRNGRSMTDTMTAKIPISINPKRKLKTQAMEIMKLNYKQKWSMTVKCTQGSWYVFSNKVEEK